MSRDDVPDAPQLETESLLRLIREQSAAEMADLRAQTAERGQRIRAAADAEVEAIRTAAYGEGEAHGQRQIAKLLAVTEADSHKQLLWTRERLIDDVLAVVRGRLADFPALPDAADLLVDLIREGLQRVPPGPVTIYLPSEYGPLLDDDRRAALATGGWTLTVVERAIPGGGAIVETGDGRLLFNNSFDARLRRQRDGLRRLIVRLLLSEGAERTQP